MKLQFCHVRVQIYEGNELCYELRQHEIDQEFCLQLSARGGGLGRGARCAAHNRAVFVLEPVMYEHISPNLHTFPFFSFVSFSATHAIYFPSKIKV